MKKAILIISAVMAGCLIFRWDYHLSNFMFDRLCNDPEKIGLFVYEKVELPDEYIEPLPTGWTHHDDYEYDPRFEFGEAESRFFDGEKSGLRKGLHYRYAGGYRINRVDISDEYKITFYEPERYSKIGPIIISRSAIHRKSDGRLLGEAASAVSLKGWFAQVGTLSGTARIHCSGGQGDEGFPNYHRSHNNLVKAIFENRVKEK